MMQWCRSFRFIEELVSLALAASLSAWLMLFNGSEAISVGDQSQLVSIVSILASLYGSILGFLLAVLALLFGSIAEDKFRLLRESKPYNDLWWIFRSAIRSCAFALVISVISLAWIWFKHPSIIVLVVMFGCFVLVVLRIGGVVWILEKLMDVEIAKGRRERESREA